MQAAQSPQVQAASSETLAAAMQLAIALLTAGLDSAELEAWAADALTPIDMDGLGDFMAGLHVISVLLLNELHEATGEPSAAILQRLAFLAERGRAIPLSCSGCTRRWSTPSWPPEAWSGRRFRPRTAIATSRRW